MSIVITQAERNHLRLLIGWIRCTVGQSPEEMKATLSSLAPAIGDDVSDEAKRLFVEQYWASQSVPKYVRAAIKALEKVPLSTEHLDRQSVWQAPKMLDNQEVSLGK